MEAALVPVVEARVLPPSEPGSPHELAAAFLAGRKATTVRAYRAALENFAAFVGAPSVGEAARVLLAAGHGGANGLALAYRNSLLEDQLSPATVNLRLAALRSLVALARTLGLVPWTLEAPSVRSRSYRDTRGPGSGGFRAVLVAVEARGDRKAVRDRALLRLLYDLALRRAEAVALDLEDLDLQGKTLRVLGKGRTEKETLSLPAPTVAALSEWLAVRGTEPGPLFVNFDRARKGERLTGRSVARLVALYGAEAGLKVRPHGLRHAAITEALDRTGGDIRRVQRFSRHLDLRVLTRYDDNRTDLAGEVAALVAASV